MKKDPQKMNVLHSTDSKPQDTSYGHGVESFIHYLWIISQSRNGCQSRFPSAIRTSTTVSTPKPIGRFKSFMVTLCLYFWWNL